MDHNLGLLHTNVQFTLFIHPIGFGGASKGEFDGGTAERIRRGVHQIEPSNEASLSQAIVAEELEHDYFFFPAGGCPAAEFGDAEGWPHG